MSVLKRYNGSDFETVGLPEAPSDSKQYARKNGSWEEVSHQSLSAYRTASAQDVIDGTKQKQNIQRTVTIAVADWSGGTTCTKTVTGVTSTNTVIVDSSDATVSATAQGTDELTFTATATPLVQVTIKVVIFP